MLVLSAGASFLLHDRLWTAARSGNVPLWAPLIPPAFFTAFVLVYTVDRWVLVRRHHYPAGRAFFQVAFSLVFLSLLWPQQASELHGVTHPRVPADYALAALDNPSPAARAAACELLGRRGQHSATARVQHLAAHDPEPVVRRACSNALVMLRPPNGPPQAPQAVPEQAPRAGQ